jgi:stage II sporulation protein AA (anti-sigma F factor antagonist)
VDGLGVFVTVLDSAGTSCTVVRLVGEADATTTSLRDVLDAEAAKIPKLLLIDMSGLTFIDSSAIGVLMRAHEQLTAAGGVLALACPQNNVARVLHLIGADRAIPVYASLDEAFVSMAPGQGTT